MATANTDRRAARSQADWDTLARDTIVPLLQQGVPMTAIRKGGHPQCPDGFGAGPTIRRALDRVGYTTKGEPVDAVAVKATGKALAAKVHALRLGGHNGKLMAWWELEHRTGKSQDELKALLAAHGYTDTTAGRVTRVQATAAQVKPARKPRKAKASA